MRDPSKPTYKPEKVAKKQKQKQKQKPVKRTASEKTLEKQIVDAGKRGRGRPRKIKSAFPLVRSAVVPATTSDDTFAPAMPGTVYD